MHGGGAVCRVRAIACGSVVGLRRAVWRGAVILLMFPLLVGEVRRMRKIGLFHGMVGVGVRRVMSAEAKKRSEGDFTWGKMNSSWFISRRSSRTRPVYRWNKQEQRTVTRRQNVIDRYRKKILACSLRKILPETTCENFFSTRTRTTPAPAVQYRSARGLLCIIMESI